jgi:hypothetical protein
MIDARDQAGPLCSYCGEVLGVYEPLIVVDHDRGATRTSRLNQGGSPPAGVMVHEQCYEQREPSSEQRSA